MTGYVISALPAAPEHLPRIAERCWTAWWQNSGISLETYRGWVTESLAGHTIPATFVAHRSGNYLGSVALIANDLESRPHYTPWLAALWVEQDHRHQGIARALLRYACQQARQAGFPQVFLCSDPVRRPLYLSSGFSLIEEDVEQMDIFTAGTSTNLSATAAGPAQSLPQ